MNSPRRNGRAMAAILSIGVIVYIAVAVAFAVYLLTRAFSHEAQGVSEFEKASLGALIVVIGTGLTAFAALYTAERQAATAREVESLKDRTAKELATFTAGTARDLATFTSKLTGDVEDLKAQSAQSLERLKAYLDAEKIAHRELCSAASMYFYALRSAALDSSWDEQFLKEGEAGMIKATQHLIYVGEQMRDDWLNFWQEAQHIYRAALAKPIEERPQLLWANILEMVPDGLSRLNLRDRYAQVEHTASRAIREDMSTQHLQP